MEHNLFVANCVDFMADMQPESVDLTITSPPYDDLRTYNGYDFDFESIAEGLYRVTKQGGVVVWVVNDATINGSETGTSFRQALGFMEVGFNLHDTMIYQKPTIPIGGSNRYYQCFEYMFVFSKDKPKKVNLIEDRKNRYIHSGRQKGKRQKDGTIAKQYHAPPKEYGRRGNVWQYSIGFGHTSKDKIAFEHPAIFPEKLAEDHILSWSNENDLVFDPMCGSGTVGKMALIHNRQFIGVDISAEYIEIARERISTIQQRIF